MEIEPIDPETAFELYLAEKETSVADATLVSHRSRLKFFIEWCGDRDIENLNELTGRKIQEFRLWRRNTGDLTKASVKTIMDTLRVFVKWLESIDAIEQDLHKKVRSPDLTPGENSRDVMIETDDAEAMLRYLERYEYASIRHVTATLLWHTMLRMGSVRALDIRTTTLKSGRSLSDIVLRPGPLLKTSNRVSALSRCRTKSVSFSTTGFAKSDPTLRTTTDENHS